MSEILNIEFKARANNLSEIENQLKKLNAKDLGVDHQIDYYFNRVNGRLKLRRGQIENSLIFYKRADQLGSKESVICLEKFTSHNSLEKILEASNGIKTIVDKKRQTFFIDNVKFHLDTVLGLGTFFEIEAIDDSEYVSSEIKKKLEIQCRYYLDFFGIKEQDFIDLSYSDLIIEKKLYEDAQIFLTNIEDSQKDLKIDIFNFQIDHLCFRVENIYDYYFQKEIFEKLGTFLVESQISGRIIATYKLHRAIEYKNQKIFLIELPAPKKNRFYKRGFEHAEVVISDSFATFINRFPHLTFDEKSRDKKINPEIRLNLAQGINVKFHHQSLEDVILIEKQS